MAISESKTETCPLLELTERKDKVNVINVLGEEKIKQEKRTGVGAKRPMWLDPLAQRRWVSEAAKT